MYIYCMHWQCTYIVFTDNVHILYSLTMYIYCMHWQCTYIVFTDNVHILYSLTMYIYCIHWQCTYIVFTDNVHILYPLFILQCQKVQNKYSEKSRNMHHSDCFQWCPLSRPLLYCYSFLPHESGTRKAMTIYSKKDILSVQFDTSKLNQCRINISINW
jgi:hypothetical protein